MTQRAQTMEELADELADLHLWCKCTDDHQEFERCKGDICVAQRDAIAAALRSAPAPGGIEAREALEKIKEIVVGDKVPNWKDTDATYASRGKIADLCDITLQSQPVQPAGCICQEQHRRGYCTEPGCLYVRPDAPVVVRTALQQIETKAREWAGHYTPHSDGRNTFILFAEWVASLEPVRGDSSDAQTPEPGA